MITKEEFKERLIREINNLKIQFKSKSLITKFDRLSFLINNPKLLIPYPSEPQKAKLIGFKDTSEKYFQRKIYNSNKSYLGINRDMIVWLDLELPVVFSNKARRCSVDLIGELNSIPILCELKYIKKQGGDRPEYALFELLTYFYFVMCNSKNLDKENVHHMNCKSFNWQSIVQERTKLIICANEKYWDYWFTRIKKECLTQLINNLNKKFNVELLLFKTNIDNLIEWQLVV